MGGYGSETPLNADNFADVIALCCRVDSTQNVSMGCTNGYIPILGRSREIHEGEVLPTLP